LNLILATTQEIQLESFLKLGVKDVLVSYFYVAKRIKNRNIYQKLQGDYNTKAPQFNKLLSQFDYVMIDSGAYSYFSGTAEIFNDYLIDKYVEQYGLWLKDNKDYYTDFVEMDIDKMINYDLKRIEKYRKYLEDCAGKKSIPVWHVNRGLEYWDKMTQEYDYVGIGGIAINEFRDAKRKIYHMLKIARKNKCRVHAFGFTFLNYLKLIPLDSVDSSSCTTGSRYGVFYLFLDKKLYQFPLQKLQKSSKINGVEFDNINFKTWKLYKDYLKKYWEKQNIKQY